MAIAIRSKSVLLTFCAGLFHGTIPVVVSIRKKHTPYKYSLFSDKVPIPQWSQGRFLLGTYGHHNIISARISHV